MGETKFRVGDIVIHESGGIGIVIDPAYQGSRNPAVNWIIPPPGKLWFFRDQHPEFDIVTTDFTLLERVQEGEKL